MWVHDIVQEAMVKTIPKKKKWKMAQWLSAEALQIAEKRIEAKGKGEKERYMHLTEFQRIARRDKKAFLSDQYSTVMKITKITLKQYCDLTLDQSLPIVPIMPFLEKEHILS